MKTLHPAQKRLLIGCLLLLATFFNAFAPDCGLAGRLVHYVFSHLLGQTGCTLLSLGMLVTGTLFILPHDSLGRFLRWALHGREARVAKVVYESDEWIRTAEVKRIVADAIKAHVGLQAVRVPESTEQLSVEHRRKLDTVRSCLKQLQYRANEYEPVVQALTDLDRPADQLIREAIKTLTGKIGSKASRPQVAN